MRRTLLVAVCSALCLPACSDDTVVQVSLSIALSDGRSCRDASVTTIEIARGAKTPLRFICVDAAAPRSVDAAELPLSDELSVFGLSADGGPLYRGQLVPQDALAIAAAAPASAPAPPALIELYPAAAR